MSKRGSLLLNRLSWRAWGTLFALRTGSRRAPKLFRATNVGAGSYVDPTVQIFGWRQVFVGAFSVLSEDVWLNVNRRGENPDRIIIGDHCLIGRRNYFSTGGVIRVRDFAFTGVDCHFLGCGHDYRSPSVPYTIGLSAGASIEVGVNCWISTSVTVMEGVKIGHGSVVGARSVVLHDIPPFSIAVGTPARVIQRFDFARKSWVDARQSTEDLEAAMPSEAEYLALLNREYGELLPSLPAASKRFGWLP